MSLRRLVIRLAFFALALVCTGLVLFWGTVSFGLVSGEEFSPDTFQRRSYHYYELPLIRLKITPVIREVQRNQLEGMLAVEQYVVPRRSPTRWDLVACHRAGEPWLRGDAQILCWYLDAGENTSEGSYYWKKWTVEHPSLAKILWAEIAALARRMHYFLVPHVFAEALAHEGSQRFQEDVNLLLARRYNMLAAAAAKLGNLETAIRLYGHALTHQPGGVGSLEGRAACYEELGRDAEAARDRQRLTRPGEPEQEHEYDKHDH